MGTSSELSMGNVWVGLRGEGGGGSLLYLNVWVVYVNVFVVEVN